MYMRLSHISFKYYSETKSFLVEALITSVSLRRVLFLLPALCLTVYVRLCFCVEKTAQEPRCVFHLCYHWLNLDFFHIFAMYNHSIRASQKNDRWREKRERASVMEFSQREKMVQ